MPKTKKRGNNEGTIVKRKDGRWMASITIGRDPTTGKLKRAWFYGKTRQEAAASLAKALRDRGQGVFVTPHKMTLDVHFISSLPVMQRPVCKAWADKRPVQIVGAVR